MLRSNETKATNKYLLAARSRYTTLNGTQILVDFLLLRVIFVVTERSIVGLTGVVMCANVHKSPKTRVPRI